MSEEKMHEWHCGICLAQVVAPFSRDVLRTVEDEHRLHRGEAANTKFMCAKEPRTLRLREGAPCLATQ